MANSAPIIFHCCVISTSLSVDNQRSYPHDTILFRRSERGVAWRATRRPIQEAQVVVANFKSVRVRAELVGDNKGVIGFNLSFLFDRQDPLGQAMRELLAWANTGRLQPPQVTAFPLAEVGKAHQAIESGQTTGKLVLVP